MNPPRDQLVSPLVVSWSVQEVEALQVAMDDAPFTLTELVSVIRRYPRTIRTLAHQGD